MSVRHLEPDTMTPEHTIIPGGTLMAEHDDDDNHGNSTAAWVMVGILLLASAVMSVAVAFPNVPLFIGGIVLAIVGLVAGKLLALAGYGVNGDVSRRDSNIS